MKFLNDSIEIFKVKCKRSYEKNFGNKDQSLMLAFKEQRLRNELSRKA